MKLPPSDEAGLGSESQNHLHVVVRATLGSNTAIASAPGIDEARERLSDRIAGERYSGRKDASGLSISSKVGSQRARTLRTRSLLEGIASLVTRTLRGEKVSLGNQPLRLSLWFAVLVAVIGGVFTLTRRINAPLKDVTRVYATHSDQRAIVNLDDATRITLAPQTTLRVLQFGRRTRTVVLERGEAYFEVAHAAGIPFVVRSGTATTQVLGTAFLIRHNPGDAHVRVAVTDGKVRVTNVTHADSSVTLTLGQVGDVTDSTTHVSAVDDVLPGMEWAPGRIIFRDTPLSAVLQTISRWYGYQFRLTDQTLGARSVTMVISTRSSAEALAAIERVLLVNLTVVGDTVTLVPQLPRLNRSAPRTRTYDVWTPKREVGR